VSSPGVMVIIAPASAKARRATVGVTPTSFKGERMR
jgi:hypothetical protein